MSKKIDLIDLDKIKFENYCFGGVWALFGKRKNSKDDNLYCLQVAQTKNIKKEIKKTIDKLYDQREEFKSEKVKFVNQFNEVWFSYDRFPKHTIYLYQREIFKEFDELKIGIVYKSKSEYIEDVEKIKLIEKYFAHKTRAVYWKNGGSYKGGNDENLVSNDKGFNKDKYFKERNKNSVSKENEFNKENIKNEMNQLIKDSTNKKKLNEIIENFFKNKEEEEDLNKIIRILKKKEIKIYKILEDKENK